MKKILFILPVLAMAAGCAEKLETPALEQQGRLLGISVTCSDFPDMEAPGTKAVEDGTSTKFTDGDAIGIFAVKDGAVMEDCRNVKCVYDEASSSWNGKVYEYAGAEYFAYYPYSEDMSDKGSTEEIVSAFTETLSSVTDQSTHALYTACDLMTAGNTAPDAENSILDLSFSHAMSMVEVVLPQIEYRTSADAEPYYSIPVIPVSMTVGGAAVSPYMVEPGVYRYIVAPGSSVSLSGEYESLGKSYGYESTGLTVSAGKYKRLKVTSTTSSIIHTMSVGDFFMNTGELVSKDADLTAEQQENCIGVIFWTGNPSVTDVTLRNDWPGCTHGLVVAMDEIQSNWSAEVNVVVNDWIKSNTSYLSIGTTGDDANTNNIVGYNNTLAIDAYNRLGLAESADIVNAVANVLEYRAANPVDCGASGWYLPSVKELALLFMGDGSIWATQNDVAQEINKSLEKVSGATLLTGDYWSNTETAAGSVHRIESTGKITSTRAFNTYKVRPVMAF